MEPWAAGSMGSGERGQGRRRDYAVPVPHTQFLLHLFEPEAAAAGRRRPTSVCSGTGNPRHHWAHAANVLQLNLRKTSLYKISVKGAPNQTGFLNAALLLVDALKKNSVRQKFIRKKTVNTEAKIEENKDLRDRVKYGFNATTSLRKFPPGNQLRMVEK